MNDFRALCAEGVAFIRFATDLDDLSINAEKWAKKARAALAEPKSIEDRIAEADAAMEASIKRVRRIASMPAREIAAEFRARAARRPKPPSLKKQALQALNEAVYMADDEPPEGISMDQADIIRRALESLPD